MPKSIKFSMLFWIDFLMDFGSQNPPKSIPRHLENWALATAPCTFSRYCLFDMVIDFSSILGSIFDRFLEDFGSPNRSKNRSKRPLENWWILASIFDGFLDHFWSQNRSKMKKSSIQIITKINVIFHRIFYRFWLYFGPPRPPQNWLFFICFCSWCRSWAILAPRGSPKCSKTAPELDFQGFGTILGRILEQISTISRLHSNTKFPSSTAWKTQAFSS